MQLRNKQINFYDTLGEILFIDFIKENYKYENGQKTEEIDSFSIRCFSIEQKDCFVLKILDMDYLTIIKTLDMFTKIDVLNGRVTEFKNQYYFKSMGVKIYE